MKALARRHRVSVVSLLGEEFDGPVAERAMRAYCDEVVLVPRPPDRGAHKRLLQLRSLASWKSYEHHSVALPQMQDDLGFSQENLSWVFNAYVVAFGGLLLLGGKLSDLRVTGVAQIV